MDRREWEYRQKVFRRRSWTQDISWHDGNKQEASLAKDKTTREANEKTWAASRAFQPQPATKRTFFDLPREVRDRVYEFALHRYPRQVYEYRAWIDGWKTQKHRHVTLKFVDGIVVFRPRDKANDKHPERRDDSLGETESLAYEECDEFEKFCDDTHDEDEDDEEDELFNFMGSGCMGRIWICDEEMEESADTPMDTPDWVHPRIEPRLDSELQARAHHFAAQDLDAIDIDGLIGPRDEFICTEDFATEYFAKLVAENPFLLRQANLPRNRRVKLKLFYTGNFLEPLRPKEWYRNHPEESKATQPVSWNETTPGHLDAASEASSILST
ncbi:MAG: hypothetical protein Q9162_003794 [Coniocarpon cinnabarinum]